MFPYNPKFNVQMIFSSIDKYKQVYMVLSALIMLIAVGPVNIYWFVYTFCNYIFQIIGSLLETVTMILISIVYPLLNMILSFMIVVSILVVALSGLFVAGVFTCPTEESFVPWLKSFISTNMNQQSQLTSTDKLQVINNFMKKYVINALTSNIMSYTMFKQQNFYHCGAFRIALCIGSSDGEQVIFIGAFNTWFPTSF